MTLHLKHLGKGTFEAANAYDRQQALSRFHEGEALFCEIKKPRSSLQNRALFAALNKAWENQRGERWESPEYLRADAFCQVGFKTTIFYELPEDAEATEAEMQKLETFVSKVVNDVYAKDSYAFIKRVGDRGVAVDLPRSWQFNVTEHEEATKVMDAVLDFLVERVCPGITRKQLLEAVNKDPS